MTKNIPQWCKCRNCSKKYESAKSRADTTGYCSQKCLIAKAKECGWRKVANRRNGYSMYTVLRAAGEIGNVEWVEPAIIPFERSEVAGQRTPQFVWVFTAECADHGRQVIAVTDYDPEVEPDHLWELLERYLGQMPDGAGDLAPYLEQYVGSDFQVDKSPVLTQG